MKVGLTTLGYSTMNDYFRLIRHSDRAWHDRFFSFVASIFEGGRTFSAWGARGGWVDGYDVFAVVVDDQVVSTVGRQSMRYVINGKERNGYQIGAVATHADHRNLSAAMRDVLYYVGHPGMAFDARPCALRSAWMYTIEAPTEELHAPDLLFDTSDVFTQKAAALTGTRPIFGPLAVQAQAVELYCEVPNRFWGMRCGVRYAEPLYQTWGSMRLAQLTRDHFRTAELPLMPPPWDAGGDGHGNVS